METSAQVSVETAIEHCRAVTYRSRNNLAVAARRLPHPAQQRLFVTTYASMRVLDDYVDDFFLALPGGEREERRADALGVLERFVTQVHDAVAGRPLPSTGVVEPVVFQAMGHLLSRAELSAAPWEALARSLRRDVREEPLQTWEDYDAYCEGACIAPASVFIYVLGCRVEEEDHTRSGLSKPLDWYARDLAVFSYLVHLLRDLAVDAGRHPQLLAIPRAEIAAAGLDLEEVVRSSRLEHWETLRSLLRRILRRADDARTRARERLDAARPEFRVREWTVLEEIFGMYESSYAEVGERVGTPPA